MKTILLLTAILLSSCAMRVEGYYPVAPIEIRTAPVHVPYYYGRPYYHHYHRWHGGWR